MEDYVARLLAHPDFKVFPPGLLLSIAGYSYYVVPSFLLKSEPDMTVASTVSTQGTNNTLVRLVKNKTGFKIEETLENMHVLETYCVRLLLNVPVNRAATYHQLQYNDALDDAEYTSYGLYLGNLLPNSESYKFRGDLPKLTQSSRDAYIFAPFKNIAERLNMICLFICIGLDLQPKA